MDPNCELAELVGLRWHEFSTDKFGEPKVCSCGFVTVTRGDMESHIQKCNPDYAADPRLVLREMAKREDFPLFMAKLMYGDNVEGIDWDHNIDIDYILDTTGLLALAARDFMRKEKP